MRCRQTIGHGTSKRLRRLPLQRSLPLWSNHRQPRRARLLLNIWTPPWSSELGKRSRKTILGRSRRLSPRPPQLRTWKGHSSLLALLLTLPLFSLWFSFQITLHPWPNITSLRPLKRNSAYLTMLSLKHREFKYNHLDSSDWLVLCFKQHFTSLAHVSIYLHNINLNLKNLYTITLNLNFRIISVKRFNDLFAPLAYRSLYLRNININMKNLNNITLRLRFTLYLHQKLQTLFAISASSVYLQNINL